MRPTHVLKHIQMCTYCSKAMKIEGWCPKLPVFQSKVYCHGIFLGLWWARAVYPDARGRRFEGIGAGRGGGAAAGPRLRVSARIHVLSWICLQCFVLCFLFVVIVCLFVFLLGGGGAGAQKKKHGTSCELLHVCVGSMLVCFFFFSWYPLQTNMEHGTQKRGEGIRFQSKLLPGTGVFFWVPLVLGSNMQSLICMINVTDFESGVHMILTCNRTVGQSTRKGGMCH